MQIIKNNLKYELINNNDRYNYEFIINDNTCKIKTDDKEFKYLELVIDEFKKEYRYIIKFKTIDNSFYKEFDFVYSFKLPIKCLQPSKFFVDEDKLKEIDDEDIKNACIPVAIINDEYVILNRHTLVYALYSNDYKMIDVYLDTPENYINDFVYIAKENNLFSIDKINVVSHENYLKYWQGFIDEYRN